MRQLGWGWAVCLCALAAGCREEDIAPSGAATAMGTSVLSAYGDTSHSIAVSTSDPFVLAREAELEQLTNNYRVAMGLNALAPLEEVRSVARAHSEHMIRHDFFDHTNPEGDGPKDRALRAGLAASLYGENITGGPGSPEAAFDAFLGSDSHRTLIENPAWTNHGHGYAYSPAAPLQHYWTQNFTRR